MPTTMDSVEFIKGSEATDQLTSSSLSSHRNSISFKCHIIAALIFFACISHIVAMPTNDFHYLRDGLHVPCTFFDTVNITGDTRYDNGSYLHDGVMIPAKYVGVYDYIYLDLVERVEVEPHYRGCICKLKPCLNFCCPWGEKHNVTGCAPADEHKWPDPKINITLDDGTTKYVSIFDQFAVTVFRPCQLMFSLSPEVYQHDVWYLYENASMYREFDMKMISKENFCMVPTTQNDSDFYVINPANCFGSNDYSTMKLINAYAMLFSVPFMVLTIIVYLFIPELRNQHGKSLVCYLIGLSIGYSLLSYNILDTNTEQIPEPKCSIIGYTTYYFFMAAFLWLSVISFDLWHNFRGTRGVNRFQEKKRFLIYSCYAWGLAAAFLVFTWLAQTHLNIPDDLKPGIGTEEYCWLDMRTWAAMIYFFGPILLVILANITMFIMTAIKIHRVQREMSRIMAREDCTRNLRSEKDNFGLYLRLFLVMGVTWIVEILSYFAGSDEDWTKIFYFTDICNAIQGFLIFMLFVMKKKVKHLITNRYSSKRDSSQQRQSQYSTKTTSSSVANLTLTEKPLMPVHESARPLSLRD